MDFNYLDQGWSEGDLADHDDAASYRKKLEEFLTDDPKHADATIWISRFTPSARRVAATRRDPTPPQETIVLPDADGIITFMFSLAFFFSNIWYAAT